MLDRAIRRYGRTRLVLVALMLVSLGCYALFVPETFSSALAWTEHGDVEPAACVVVACVLLVAGHLLRAQRTRIAVNNAYPGPFSAHFGALSIGFLFNALLPFKLGELIRTWLLARKLRISLLYTLCVILLERLLDVVLISALFLVGVLLGPWSSKPMATGLAIASLLISSLLLIAFLAVVGGNRTAVRAVAFVSSLFNTRIQGRLQFSSWTVIYGFQRLRGQPRLIAAYLGTFLLSWACYFAATATLVIGFSGIAWTAPDVVAATVGPFVPGSSWLWPVSVDGIDSLVSSSIPQLDALPRGDRLAFDTAAWFVITMPIAVIGAVWVFIYSVLPSRTQESAALQLPDYSNKLDRFASPGRGLPGFLGAYFRGENLVHVLHELEVRGDLTLVRMFKGGSNAVTILSQQHGELTVKKVVPSQHADKLKMQYDWLVRHRHLPRIVQPLAEERGEDYYAISLDYLPTSVPLFDYVHTRSLGESKARLREVWEFMAEHVYPTVRDQKPGRGAEVLDSYVRDRLLGRLDVVTQVHEALATARSAPTLTVNGTEYRNFDAVMSEIRANATAWADLAAFRVCDTIHGDLTVDNILVDSATDQVIVIDPSDDNQVRGPVLDFARHLQSLGFGYEFLNMDDAPVHVQVLPGGGHAVEYTDVRSAQYAELERYVREEIAPTILSAAEQRSLLFHAGLFYGRMLSHRVVIDPENALKYYGTCVVALNRFIAQYR